MTVGDVTNGTIWGFPKIMGTLFWGPHNKGCSILGSIMGSPYFGKVPFCGGRRFMKAQRVGNVGLRIRASRIVGNCLLCQSAGQSYGSSR